MTDKFLERFSIDFLGLVYTFRVSCYHRNHKTTNLISPHAWWYLNWTWL